MRPLPVTEGRISMSNIYKAFEKNKAFIAFITAGYPDIETSKKIIKSAADAGADIIEIGIPFSDPTAEGPVIQGANEVALEAGITTDKVFEMVEELRRDIDIPLCFMTYANVVFSYGNGKEDFLERCCKVGIDGIILPDVPFEEKKEFDETCEKYGIDLISLIAPTSEGRISMIAKEAKGFIYVVSSLGVTGVRNEITTDIGSMVRLVKDSTDTPCAVGFGISRPEQASKMAHLSDGAIVGSAIIKIISEAGDAAPEKVYDYVKEMSDAVHATD